MKRFVVMEPLVADGPSAGAVFVRDGFSWFAFLLPLVWLLWQRLWLAALLVLGLAVGVSFLGSAGFALQVLLAVLVALEGPAWAVARLRRRGLTERTAFLADSRSEAEEIYFTSGTSALSAGSLGHDPVAAPSSWTGGWRPARTLLGTAEAR